MTAPTNRNVGAPAPPPLGAWELRLARGRYGAGASYCDACGLVRLVCAGGVTYCGGCGRALVWPDSHET